MPDTAKIMLELQHATGHSLARVIIIWTSAVLLSACGIGSLSELHQETKRAADIIEKDLGSRPQIGFSGWNGTVLVSVTIAFKSGDVASMQVAELESRVRRGLAAALKESPQSVVVSVLSGPLQLR